MPMERTNMFYLPHGLYIVLALAFVFVLLALTMTSLVKRRVAIKSYSKSIVPDVTRGLDGVTSSNLAMYMFFLSSLNSDSLSANQTKIQGELYKLLETLLTAEVEKNTGRL